MLGVGASLHRSWQTDNQKYIEVPWPSLSRLIRPHGGQTVVLLAAPGVGKTYLAVNWVAKAGLRTLYISSDTDPQDMTLTLAALAGKEHKDKLERQLREDPRIVDLYANAAQSCYPNLVFDFSPSLSIQDIALRAYAVTELWGCTPDVVVLDTASDIDKGGEGFESWDHLWLQIRGLSRLLNTVVFLCHHVNEGRASSSGQLPPEQNDAAYKGHKYPEMVLGLWSPGPDIFKVKTLKNRGGIRNHVATLAVDYAMGDIYEREG